MAKSNTLFLPPAIEVLWDVHCGVGGGQPLHLHLARPSHRPRPLPAVVCVHGGGWMGGDKQWHILDCIQFARRGYVAASISYRFAPAAIFPTQIEDCKCAVRFLRAHAAALGLDPARIGVWGSSAGGHLVALMGTTNGKKEFEGTGGWAEFSSDVQAVCDFCGPSDLHSFARQTEHENQAGQLVKDFLGGTTAERPELARQASPLAHVSPAAPPFLIMHGDKDDAVLPVQSQMLHNALRDAGVDSALEIIPGAGHGFGGPEIMDKVHAFFARHLGPKP